MRFLEIGGVRVFERATERLTQRTSYEDGASETRMTGGALDWQLHYEKLVFTFSGSGSVPPGLNGLPFGAGLTLKAIEPLSIASALNAIALPSSRRSDAGHLPHGFAQKADGTLVATPVAMAGDVANLTAVPGAVGYLALWYPQVTVRAQRPEMDGDNPEALTGWTMVCREV